MATMRKSWHVQLPRTGVLLRAAGSRRTLAPNPRSRVESSQVYSQYSHGHDETQGTCRQAGWQEGGRQAGKLATKACSWEEGRLAGLFCGQTQLQKKPRLNCLSCVLPVLREHLGPPS